MGWYIMLHQEINPPLRCRRNGSHHKFCMEYGIFSFIPLYILSINSKKVVLEWWDKTHNFFDQLLWSAFGCHYHQSYTSHALNITAVGSVKGEWCWVLCSSENDDTSCRKRLKLLLMLLWRKWKGLYSTLIFVIILFIY